MGQPAQSPVLRKRLEITKDRQLAEACMMALGLLGDAGAVPRLKAMIEKPKTPSLLVAASRAYALIRQYEAVPLLIKQFDREPNTHVMGAVVRSLAMLPSTRAAAPLRKLLKRGSIGWETRMFALRGLGVLADTDDYPVLTRLGFGLNYYIRCPPLDVLFETFS